jgi:hypothetical protein
MACWDAAGCSSGCGVSRLSSCEVKEYAVGAEGLVHHGERAGGDDVLAGDCRPAGPGPARRPQRRRRTAGIARQARAGTVTMPRGSRRATTTPGSAVRVSRSPSRQPRAQRAMAWSVTRPEASIRPVPYTTSAGADRAAPGPAMGSGRTASGLTRGVPARRPGDGMTGGIGWPVMAVVPGDGGRLGCQVDDCWGCGRYRCGCCVASCEKAYTAVFNNRPVSPIMKE